MFRCSCYPRLPLRFLPPPAAVFGASFLRWWALTPALKQAGQGHSYDSLLLRELVITWDSCRQGASLW